MIQFRKYQQALVEQNGPGVVILHWARQIGKSYTLAAWAVNRLLGDPGRLVTVLSNSRENGAEFLRKCAEVCREMQQSFELDDAAGNEPSHPSSRHLPVEGRGRRGRRSSNIALENFRMEVRITTRGRVGRIKVLAANPRTARGFSGDLILDEFAFHEDSAAIWEAAEPILASNPSFKCRIASTGNGKHNMFYRMVSGVRSSGMRSAECGVRNEEGSGSMGSKADANVRHGGALDDTRGACAPRTEPNDCGEFFTSAAGFTVSRVTRTAAYRLGVKIYDLKGKRGEITPEAARKEALDKRAYDQNYECAFADENMTLLTYGLIAAAQSQVVTIDAQEWSAGSVARMRAAKGLLQVGNDIGRNRDLSMVTVIERVGQMRRVVAMLKMENMRLPDQQKQLAVVCRMPTFHAYCGDMTGLGLGLVEYLQEQFGRYRIRGVNFSSTEPASDRIKIEGRKQETARVTEIMAVNLLACFEERSLKDLPDDAALVEDLRKPEKMTSPGGRVSIAATRDEAGHADGFWSLALAVRAGELAGEPFAYQAIKLPNRFVNHSRRNKGLIG